MRHACTSDCLSPSLPPSLIHGSRAVPLICIWITRRRGAALPRREEDYDGFSFQSQRANVVVVVAARRDAESNAPPRRRKMRQRTDHGPLDKSLSLEGRGTNRRHAQPRRRTTAKLQGFRRRCEPGPSASTGPKAQPTPRKKFTWRTLECPNCPAEQCPHKLKGLRITTTFRRTPVERNRKQRKVEEKGGKSHGPTRGRWKCGTGNEGPMMPENEGPNRSAGKCGTKNAGSEKCRTKISRLKCRPWSSL